MCAVVQVALDDFFQPYRSTYTMNSASLTDEGRIGKAKVEAQSQALPVPDLEVPSTPPSADLRSRSRTVDSEDIDEDLAHYDDQEDGSPDREDEGASLEAARSGQASKLEGQPSGPSLMNWKVKGQRPSLVDPRDEQDEDAAAGMDLPSPPVYPDSNEDEGQDEPSPPAKKQRITIFKQPTLMTLDTSKAKWSLKTIDRAERAARVSARGSSDEQVAGTSDDVQASAIELPSENSDAEDVDIGAPKDRPRLFRPASTTPAPFAEVESAADQRNGIEELLGDQEFIAISAQVSANASKVVGAPDGLAASTSAFTSQLAFDLAATRERLKRRKRHHEVLATHDGMDATAEDVEEENDIQHAGIETEADEARQALSRLISKEDFAEMDIVGQFNLAFVIARRRCSAGEGEGKGRATPLTVHDDLMIIE